MNDPTSKPFVAGSDIIALASSASTLSKHGSPEVYIHPENKDTTLYHFSLICFLLSSSAHLT